MQYLGLDLGTKTLGVAISDKTNTLAVPLELIKFKFEDYDEAISKLINIIEKNSIKDVVLGLPKNMDNSMGFASIRSLNFKEKLEKIGLNVYLEDERLTSVTAINILKESGKKNIKGLEKTDIISAQLILDSFLKRKAYEKK